MSEYSGIRGTRVKYLASDPTLNTSTEGQVWYNSTSGTLKSLVQIKAFSSAGANMSTARAVHGSAGHKLQDFRIWRIYLILLLDLIKFNRRI
jgi:hypothetical protein